MDSLQPTILIVDDEKHTRDGLRRLLEDEYDTYVAEDIRGAMDVLEREPIDVMITDLRLGGDDGMVLIERALKLPHPPICIMMTAYGSVDTAVEAMKRGAYDFVTKPLNLDKVEILIARAVASRKMEQKTGRCASRSTSVTGSKTSSANRRRSTKCSTPSARSRRRRRMF